MFFVSGGSDAIDTAAKLARRFWQLQGQTNKRIIISREWAYHGLHGFGTSIGGIPYNREGYGSESLIPETARVPANDADALEAEIVRLGPDRVAAVFAEPIIGTGGVILPAPGYLQRVEQICEQYDVLFVADEVITGFGRTGEMFATGLFDLHPDMIVMAKGITSGYAPLGGVLIAPRVWEPFFADGAPIFRHGVTYSGHATACAVAQANLDVLEEEQLVARVATLAPVLEQTMTPLDQASAGDRGPNRDRPVGRRPAGAGRRRRGDRSRVPGAAGRGPDHHQQHDPDLAPVRDRGGRAVADHRRDRRRAGPRRRAARRLISATGASPRSRLEAESIHRRLCRHSAALASSA